MDRSFFPTLNPASLLLSAFIFSCSMIPGIALAKDNPNASANTQINQQAVPKKHLPLWELGLGLGYASIPGYVGSDHRDEYVLPVPILYYHGEKLKVNRQRVKAVLFNNDRLEAGISVRGYPPVDSKDNRAREGMEDLDIVAEGGPSIIYRMKFGEYGASLELPVRMAFAFDTSYIDDRGFTSNPRARLTRTHGLSSGGAFSWTLTLGTYFATKRYYDYYYGVDEAFVTPTRSAYEASSGYGGYFGSLSTVYRFDDWRIGFFTQHQNLKDAKFEDSPLVEKSSAALFGFYVNKLMFSGGRRARGASAYEDDL